MKYFCISDVHGQYEKMVEALEAAGFNKEKDTLVSVGDLFDRGPKSKEVLEYVMSCPNRLLCMGNHDLRLMQLIRTPYLFNQYDTYNGVPETLKSFLGPEQENLWNKLAYLRGDNMLRNYFRECHAAYEFSNLIITHAWVPVIEVGWKGFKPYQRSMPDGTIVDWHRATSDDWDEALWCNVEKRIENKIYPEKTILLGHWHAWRLAEKFGEKRQTNKHDPKEYIDCSSFEYEYKGEKKFIAIDGCTNYPYGGCVNVYQFETDEIPNVIFGGLGKWFY